MTILGYAILMIVYFVSLFSGEKTEASIFFTGAMLIMALGDI